MARRGKAWTVQPPDLKQFKNRPLYLWIEELMWWIRQLMAHLAEPPGEITESVVLLTSTLTGRTGATMGTGTAQLVDLDDAGAMTARDSITLRHIGAQTLTASGKYGTARKYQGHWVLVSLECF